MIIIVIVIIVVVIVEVAPVFARPVQHSASIPSMVHGFRLLDQVCRLCGCAPEEASRRGVRHAGRRGVRQAGRRGHQGREGFLA